MSSFSLSSSNLTSDLPGDTYGLSSHPSSRASPLPRGKDDYHSWLTLSTKQVTSRGSLTALDISATKLQLERHAPASPADMASPMGSFLGAVFGGPGASTPSSPMTPRLPPRHKAHDNVYRSPHPRPASGPSVPRLQRNETAKATLHSSAPGGTRNRPQGLSNAKQLAKQDALCKYCGVRGSALHVQLPGPSHRSGCQRFSETEVFGDTHLQAEYPTSVKSKQKPRMTRATRPTSSSVPPRGPGDGIDSDGSCASAEEFSEEFGRVAPWALTGGCDDEGHGVLGPLGMFLLLLVIVFTTHQHRPKINRLYKYK